MRQQIGTMKTHRTGYHVHLFGETFWHRSLDSAIARAQAARYCPSAQVIEVATGVLMYGTPQ